MRSHTTTGRCGTDVTLGSDPTTKLTRSPIRMKVLPCRSRVCIATRQMDLGCLVPGCCEPLVGARLVVPARSKPCSPHLELVKKSAIDQGRFYTARAYTVVARSA